MEENKMEQNIIYNGNHVFKNINFGLYGYEDIDFYKTKDSILFSFKKKYVMEIKKGLNSIGLRFERFNYFSPREYNFSNDSIDLVITISNKKKLRNAVLKHKERIDASLSKNKSYDGYMALTVNNVDEELEKMKKKGYEPDIIVLKELLDLDCTDFNIKDYFVFSD